NSLDNADNEYIVHFFPTRRSSDLHGSEFFTGSAGGFDGKNKQKGIRGKEILDISLKIQYNQFLQRIAEIAQLVEHFTRNEGVVGDRKSTRLNSSHVSRSYAVYY